MQFTPAGAWAKLQADQEAERERIALFASHWKDGGIVPNDN